MKLFEIALPTKDNVGKSYGRALKRWEKLALSYAGGYTKLPVAQGAWRDPQTGLIYRDLMRGYRVACSPSQFGCLIHAAWECFPDQVAFFTAELGEASIVEGPAAVAEVAKGKPVALGRVAQV
jgi:hypothetical protein